MSSIAPTTECQMSKICHGPPPPPNLTNGTSSIQLLSQGAEARVWLITLPNTSTNNDDIEGVAVKKQRTLHVGSGIHVPQLLNFTQHPSPLTSSLQSSTTSPSSASTDQPIKIICKERFPKKYRHPQLDISLTKSRTKSEARSLIRCNRANVSCPAVLAIAHWSNLNEPDMNDTIAGGKLCAAGKGDIVGKDDDDSESGSMQKTSTTSSCLFLECIEGCTVRQYFEQRSTSSSLASAIDNSKVQDDNDIEPSLKRPKVEESAASSSTSYQSSQEDRVTTVIDKQTLQVANSIGRIVGKMHAAGVIHGDLTTSNIMLRNPPLSGGSGEDTLGNSIVSDWQAELVLIDFGLAAGTNNNKPNPNQNSNNKAKHKQQHNAEEKAVDLYVLERAFLSTHPDSDKLVEEVWNGYRAYFYSLDDNGQASGSNNNQGDENESVYGHVAKAVLNRLVQVRMRGRKRECFG